MTVFIKIGQPVSSRVLWGDFHFAYALKHGLRRRGIRSKILFHEDLTKSVDLEIVLLGLNMHHYRPPAEGFSVAWLISHPEQNGPDVLMRFDAAFVCSRSLSRLWGFEYMPQAFDARSYGDVDDERASAKRAKEFEIVFIGNGRGPDRNDLLDALSQSFTDLHVWGSFHSNERITCHAPVLPRGANRVYRRARIVIGHHLEQARQNGMVNDRVYSAIASGAFLVSDRVCGVEAEFPDLVTYRSPSEAVDLCGYYLRRHEERHSIAAKCRELNVGNTFDHRAARFREVLAPYV
jgi:hypothetical protein